MPKGNPGVVRVPMAERLRRHSEARVNGCIEWTGKIQTRVDGSAGYGLLHLPCSRDQAYAHRVAWELQHGPIPVDIEICHSCDNRRCINVAHMFLGTRADNLADACRKGRMAKKHSAAAIEEARRRIVAGQHWKEIEAATGLSRSMVYKIRTGKSWRHLPALALP